MTLFALVTQSEGKLMEFERILNRKLELCWLDLPEIQAIDVEEVVTHKVKQAYEAWGKPVMIEDTGLCIDAWNGLPGALIKWFVNTVGGDGICHMMSEFSDRRALAKTVIATYDGQTTPRLFVGEVEGSIALAPAGTGGFGWDAIFIPTGVKKTFAEMSPKEKDAYSMRRQALERMMESELEEVPKVS